MRNVRAPLVVGYDASTAGLWPTSYNHCDAVASEGQSTWHNSRIGPQNYSACDDYSASFGFTPHLGRGVPQVDVFELQVPPQWIDVPRGSHIVTGLWLGPKIPPNTTHGAGLTGDCAHTDDFCTGVDFYTENGHRTQMHDRCMKPHATASYHLDATATPDILGTEQGDCIAAESNIFDTHFENQHRCAGLREQDCGCCCFHLKPLPPSCAASHCLGCGMPYRARIVPYHIIPSHPV